MAELRELADVEAYAAQHLQRARVVDGRQTYVCPECGNGSGSDGTGIAMVPEGGRLHCFKCGGTFDISDLARIVGGHPNDEQGRKASFRDAASWVGVSRCAAGCTTAQKPPSAPAESPVPPTGRVCAPEPQRATQGAAGSATRPRETPEEAAEKARAIEEGRRAEAERLAVWQAAMVEGCRGMEYMNRRGFSGELVMLFGVGWDESRDRVVIPWEASGGYYHIDRSLTKDKAHKYDKPKAGDVGPQPVHNPQAFDPENGFPVVFMVEGMFDAMAVTACGYQACGLAGTAFESSIEEAARRGFCGTLAVMLDFDGTGRQRAHDAMELAERLGVDAYLAPELPGGCKDCAELFQVDPQALAGYLAEQVRAAEVAAELRYRDALRSMRVTDTADTVTDVFTMRGATDPVPTGFKTLDAAIGGGLFPGLVVLGAISSLGKTTLTLQIADNIAEAGRTVLFATIEQSARELVSKSLSRTMRAMGNPAHDLATAQEMNDATRRRTWGPSKDAAFNAACSEYAAKVAPRMHFIEGNGPVSVADVRRVAEAMRAHDGTPPVVFVDYLQLLAPVSERDTDKQTADKNVTALRQMARDLQTPVVVISSLNRSSYSGVISMDSFKESGGIEYGADLALGLQPEGMAEAAGSDKAGSTKNADRAVDECKRSTERKCEIVILKNRNGALAGEPVPVTMRAASSVFEEGAWCQLAKASKKKPL